MYVVSLSNSCFLLLTSLFKYIWKDLFYFVTAHVWNFENIKLYNCGMHFLHCQDATYYLDWLLALFEYLQKCLMLDWNYCLSTNSHWAYLSCNLEFSVMQMRLDIGLLTNYLLVHFEHCWMEIRTLFLNCASSIVLFVGSGDKYFKLSRNLEE